MIQLLDSAAVLNDEGFYFNSGEDFLTTPLIVDEFRDMRSKNLVANALQNGLLKTREPSQDSTERINALAKEKGFTRLSIPDVSLLALALDLQRENRIFVMLTDDYSIQNFCKVLGFKFNSVIRGKIEKTISFKKRCKGCGRGFPPNVLVTKCPDCGSPVESKRLG
ncbi:MAG: hypothetical protein CL943_01065 [Candidatus Diapherotrites archaeon]|uniref:Ribonuclease PIN domain-containing protein n=1 Tax=Candidatus Iainarchaeum sp. TaxID=3101447 RepID=A0A2D6M0E8_9ARCH|nr:hypothetical protein [Candidatus Diapherotrites archaeon]|tara:strand:+ start:5397 stop:5894 length:498 start_codon:yes stop_codon:yes gene_type:complete